MNQGAETLTPSELLETSEQLLASNSPKMFRAAILEAITALEAFVRDQTFPTLRTKIGDALTDWLEEKTRMDFDTRLSLFVPVATGLTINKKSKLWNDFKKAKKIRNDVTHSGTKITDKQARYVIDIVYEWIDYLKTAQQFRDAKSTNGSLVFRERQETPYELVGRFLEASARLERIIYAAMMKYESDKSAQRNRIPKIEALQSLKLVNTKTLNELLELRNLRNRVAHGDFSSYFPVTEDKIKRLNKIVDDIEKKLG